jgi:hypothetical protein
MESTNLNSASEDDRLKSLLQAHSPGLPDDGFSHRVMAALPRPRRRVSPHVWLYLFGGVAGAVFAGLRGAAWSELTATTVEFESAFAPILAILSDPWLALAFTTTAVSLLVAYLITQQTPTLRR